MDENERLSTQIALQHILAEQPLACDLLISAFSAACKSSRRATVCKPFPTHVVGREAFDAAAAALDSLADLDSIATSTTTDEQLLLLQWLLLHLQRNWLVSQASISDVLRDAQHCSRSGGSGSSLAPGALAQCMCILRLLPAAAADAEAQQQQHRSNHSLLAYHGTDFGCVHGILQQGLLAASGTRLQSTGAAFGHGVYLSTDFATSFAFSAAREGWQGSSIGRYLRCVLLCEVDEAASSAAGGNHGDGTLPNTYMVVPRPADVRLRYLLVYCDDSLLGLYRPLRGTGSSGGGGGGCSSSGEMRGSMAGMCSADGRRGSNAAAAAVAAPRRLYAGHACWALTVAYIGFMVLLAAWKAFH